MLKGKRNQQGGCFHFATIFSRGPAVYHIAPPFVLNKDVTTRGGTHCSFGNDLRPGWPMVITPQRAMGYAHATRLAARFHKHKRHTG